MGKKQKNSDKKTKIGGQALIEGIMMKGVSVGAMAVRKKDGTIYTEEWELSEKKWYNKAPFVRGCVNFVQQLREGWSCMNKSSEISGAFDDDSDQTKFDKWLEKHFGEKGFTVISGIISFLMIAAMLAVFLFVPSYLFKLIEVDVEIGVRGCPEADFVCDIYGDCGADEEHKAHLRISRRGA